MRKELRMNQSRMFTINTKKLARPRYIVAWLVCLLSLFVVTGSPAAESANEKAMAASNPAPLDYQLKEEVLLPAGKHGSWFQPRPAPIPGYGKDGGPAVVMTIQKSLGSDFFTGLEVMRTNDMGLHWSKPIAVEELGWRDGGKGLTVGVCDFQLGWHAPTGKVLGIGHTARYTKKGFAGLGGHRRDTAYAVYDPKTDKWTPWKIVEFPKTDDDKYSFNGVHGQWLVDPDGTILLPVYFISAKVAGWKNSFIGSVFRCKFDGENLTIIDRGNELKNPVPRGLYEKSITHFQGSLLYDHA